jgi:hypothetical protein
MYVYTIYTTPWSVQAQDSRSYNIISCWLVKSVTLRLTVSQSVSLGVEPHLGLMTKYLVLFDSYGLVFFFLWGALSDERTGLSFVRVIVCIIKSFVMTRNGNWSSLYSFGTDRTGNTSYDSSTIVAYASVAAITWRLLSHCLATVVFAGITVVTFIRHATI